MFADLAAEAIDIRFEHWGLAAHYQAPGSSDPAVACTVCRAVPDRTINFGQGQPLIQSDEIEVRKSDLAIVARQGVFTLDDTAEQFRVLSDPRSDDAFALVWTMTVG